MRITVQHLLIPALIQCLAGGCAYITTGDGSGISSWDGQYTLAVSVSAPGTYKSYSDKTEKHVSIQILAHSPTDKILLRHRYVMVASDLNWETHWTTCESVSVEFHDWGDGVSKYHDPKHTTTSNHIATLAFALDRNTGTFIESK